MLFVHLLYYAVCLSVMGSALDPIAGGPSVQAGPQRATNHSRVEEAHAIGDAQVDASLGDRALEGAFNSNPIHLYICMVSSVLHCIHG